MYIYPHWPSLILNVFVDEMDDESVCCLNLY